MLPCFVLLDLETTGGNPTQDRITEVAALRIEDGVEVGRINTLINPGISIPPYIERLTGICNADVQHSPDFETVAPELLALLDGAVLVAHNVRFDQGFLTQSFKRMGLRWRTKALCTVRLSRRLFPEHKHHGLDAIMQRHGLSTASRHRAMGDVIVVQQWLEQIRRTLGAAELEAAAQALMQSSVAIAPQLETELDDIPDGPGVYLFFGEGPMPLYIGKSIKVRSRIMAHFHAAPSQAREMRMVQELRRIEYLPTAGEVGALLLEARLVKARQPLHNRQLRRQNSLCAWHLAESARSTPMLRLVRGAEFEPGKLGQLYGPYRSRRQALEQLRELADVHQLCHHALGLSSGTGPCFAYQIHRCKGLCCGEESAERHHLRLQMALAATRLHSWPFKGPVGLKETDLRSARSDLHVFDQWCHLGSVNDVTELHALLQEKTQVFAFDLDTYRLAMKYLLGQTRAGVEVIDLSAWRLPV